MLETPHVVVAAAIAYKIANPALAIPLAIGSHFVLEKVPHWNPHLNTEMEKNGKISTSSRKIIAADIAASLVLGGSVAMLVVPDFAHALTIVTACLATTLPDLIEAPYYLFNIKSAFIEKTWIPFKKSIQADTTIIPGITTQILTIIAAFWWILG